MNCPKCEHSISDRFAVECPACGVVLRKAVAEPVRRMVAGPRPQPVAKSGFSIPPRAIVTIVAIAFAVIYGMSKRQGEVTAAAAEGWYLGGEGYEQARSAQGAGQPILVYFYADW